MNTTEPPIEENASSLEQNSAEGVILEAVPADLQIPTGLQNVKQEGGTPLQEKGQQSLKTPDADESVIRFLKESKRHLSEELRFRRLRLLDGGLFIDESALLPLEKGYRDWFTALSAVDSSISLPSEEKLHKKLFGSLLNESKYLLDGKVLLFGRLLAFQGNALSTPDIPRFRGSLLDAATYIHMRDPILSETEGVTANIGARGLIVQFHTRKIPLHVDNAKLQKLARVLQQSRSIPKKFAKLQYAARFAIPAFAEIWKQAHLIPNNSPLLIPDSCRKAEKAWFLTFGDLIFVHASSGELLDCYGLRGKNLHELLVSECEVLRRLERRPRFGSMTLAPKGRWYGSVKLEGDSYLLDPLVVKKFIERLPYTKEIPPQKRHEDRAGERPHDSRGPRHDRGGKIPARFTLSDALRGAVTLIESTSWVDTVHVPRSFLQEHPKGTNFRSKGPWFIAISPKREILALFDRNDPTNQTGPDQRNPSKVGFGSPLKRKRRRKKSRNSQVLNENSQGQAATQRREAEQDTVSATPPKEQSST